MPLAPAARTGTSVTLEIGLMPIKVTLYNRTADYKNDRKQFIEVDSELHPVGTQPYDKETGEPIADKSAIMTLTATDEGFVHVTPQEIEDLFELRPNTAKVKAFQPRSLWREGRYIPKSTYAVAAQRTAVGSKKVPDKVAELSLQILADTMEERDAIAVIDLTSRGKPKAAVLVPTKTDEGVDLTLWEVCWEEEVREDRPRAPRREAPESFVSKIQTAVETFWQDEPISMSDVRTTLIQAYADEKAAAGDFSKPVEVERVEADETFDLSDLEALLDASIQSAKVPA